MCVLLMLIALLQDLLLFLLHGCTAEVEFLQVDFHTLFFNRIGLTVGTGEEWNNLAAGLAPGFQFV